MLLVSTLETTSETRVAVICISSSFRNQSGAVKGEGVFFEFCQYRMGPLFENILREMDNLEEIKKRIDTQRVHTVLYGFL